jgi:hypothetical protein
MALQWWLRLRQVGTTLADRHDAGGRVWHRQAVVAKPTMRAFGKGLSR